MSLLLIALCAVLVVAIGMGVGLFGVWCFIRGQQNAKQIAAGEAPEQIKTPVKAVSDAVRSASANKQAKQVSDMWEEAAKLLNSEDGK